MKHKAVYLMVVLLFLVFAGILYSQQQGKGEKMSDYQKEWEQVDALTQKGLPQSALEVVDKIYRNAKKSANHAQQVKALIYRLRFLALIEEDALVKNIRRVEEEIAASKYPVKPLLQSTLADLYWMYYQQNRYKILDRTQTSGVEMDDLETWDAAQFVEKVIELHNASLAERDRLKATGLDDFDALIEKQPGSREFRPTLYDLLAQRAVDFFMNDEATLTRPAYQFQLRDEKVFQPTEKFAEARFETRDTLSFKYQALLILQDLVAFHLKDDQPAALVDVDLKRLSFARQNSVHPEKETLYLNALENLEAQYREHEISTWVAYDLANFYESRGQQYAPEKGELYKWDRKKAYDVCEEAIQRFPLSDGAKNCRALQGRITRPGLSMRLEEVNLPSQPFRALIEYQNVPRVFLRIAAVNPEALREVKEKNNYNSDQWLNYYRSLPATASWTVDMPDDGDYQTHSVEIKMPALPNGQYKVLMGTDADFSREGQAVATGGTWISNLGFVIQTDPEQETGFFVFDRESGKPLEGVSAQSWLLERSGRQGNRETKSKLFRTDKNGYFQMASLSKNRYERYRIDFQYRGDRLFLEDYFTQGYRYPTPRTQAQTRTFFFLDRAIYRPGQTVYFKGIMIESSEGENQILPGRKTTVTLYDVNNQKVASLDLTSNDYGTFSGSFTAPSGGLTGIMRLRNESGSADFSVEEYKRPTFEVTFEPLSGSFKLGETVAVTAKAAAYSGANIDNAQVQYRVVRQPRFPYWWDSWRWGGFYGEEMEILNGVAQTDEKGMVAVEFTALPDLSIPEDKLPVFNYTVYLDVTDIRGETRSAQTSVQVGYVALSVSLDLPETVDQQQLPPVTITSENLNGEFEAAAGDIVIYQLQDPGRIFRPRQWQQPDKFLMSKEAYYDLFPHDVYQDEDDYRNWEKGAKVLEQRFHTAESKTVALEGAGNWAEGKYRLELRTEDKFGKAVTLTKFFTLYNLKEKTVPDHAIEWYSSIKDAGEPGQTARFAWGSAAKDVYALLEVYRSGKPLERRWIRAGKKKELLEFPIAESDRGGFGFTLFYVKFGRTFSYSGNVQVPWSNKDLTISYETFRDKLKPGAQEEWRIKIAGPGGEKAAAEMVAAMYDASLDAFRPHSWQFSLYPGRGVYRMSRFAGDASFAANSYSASGKDWHDIPGMVYRQYDRFIFDFLGGGGFFGNMGRGAFMMKGAGRAGGVQSRSFDMAAPGAPAPSPPAEDMTASVALDGGDQESAGGEAPPPAAAAADFDEVPLRRNLNETAFFYPELSTNAEGEILLKFTMPEALTRWKLLGFAHTKDLKYGLSEKTVVTQKELMVVPNAPRFFREGDRITFTAKVSNLTESAMDGSAVLKLFDALSMQPLDSELGNQHPAAAFNAAAGQSALLSWNLQIPEGVQAVTYQVIAKAGDFSDGEENMLPVLTNRMLVTESMPLPVRGPGSKTFAFRKLLDSGKSKTLRHQNLTLEFTSNPAWYAVQALPYLMEYPYECSEQVFSRYYANSLASHIANSNPRIRRVFDAWRNTQPDALLSNLEKNPELKSLLLEETPWVLEAQDESERKKRIALLFDLNKMADALQSALRKLQQMQLDNGAWPWFPGMDPSRYITGHIVSGMGHLDQLGVSQVRENSSTWEMVRRAVAYLDNEMQADYQRLLDNKNDLKKQNIGYTQIQYLYARSYFLDVNVDDAYRKAYDYWQSQAKDYWLSYNKYMQGMIALALHRMKVKDVPADIVKSLREHALHSEEFGMYWKENSGGYFWHQAPIETQALLIEVFDEVANDAQAVEDLKVWLLKQKQTQDWRTTKATAEACYALLRRGSDLLASDQLAEITVGGEKVDPRSKDDVTPEAGTGYFKTSWKGTEIQPAMGNVTVNKADAGVAWGALYWQYFEQLDKITAHETPLKLAKQLFRQENSPTGPVLTPVAENSTLRPGDRVQVRIELRVDRAMEYVHMKDMRAAGFEPVNVLSQYKYQGGLGYYESTRDAATNFFIGYLPRGTYVFEYPLRVTHAGNFSNGVTTIQCMYAPEFTSHSEGTRVTVAAKE